jgi:hypothetical protein
MSDIHSEEFPNTEPTGESAWPFVHRNDRFHSEGEVGVADYYSRKPRRSTGTLVALAPHVLLLARCEGAPETARYFSERLGVNVTEKMVKTLKFKVSRGLLVVTREELEAAALSHPITAARMIREPAICDPQHYRAAITPEEEPDEAEVKKAGVKKAAAKKAAKKEAARAKKPAETKPTATPTPGAETPNPPKGTTPAAATNLSPSPPTRNSGKGLPPIVSDAEAEENNRLIEEAARRLRGEA